MLAGTSAEFKKIVQTSGTLAPPKFGAAPATGWPLLKNWKQPPKASSVSPAYHPKTPEQNERTISVSDVVTSTQHSAPTANFAFVTIANSTSSSPHYTTII